MSCASTTECRAVDTTGGGVRLRRQQLVGAGAVDAERRRGDLLLGRRQLRADRHLGHDGAAMFDGTSWAAPQTVDLLPGDLDGVSCAVQDFCVAVDTGGYALSYDGTSWTTPAQVDGGTALTAVSCAEPSTCVAVDAPRPRRSASTAPTGPHR